jgi:hypothetical protein
LNVDLEYWSHRKTVRLMGLLGPDADVLPLRLWAYVAKHHAETGCLRGYMAEELESAARWTGAKGKMVDAMIQVGFLDNLGDGFRIHGWTEHARHIVVFKKRSKLAVKAKWLKYASSRTKSDIKHSLNEKQAEPSSSHLISSHSISEETLSSSAPTVSVPEFCEAWNKCLGEKLPAIRLPLSGSRDRKVRLRLKEHPAEEFWTEVFTAIAASDFLMGRSGNGNGRAWRVTFDWLIDNDKNCLKVAEGNYANKN